jgi:hypothetical protein
MRALRIYLRSRYMRTGMIIPSTPVITNMKMKHDSISCYIDPN